MSNALKNCSPSGSAVCARSGSPAELPPCQKRSRPSASGSKNFMIKHFKTLLRGEVDALSLEKPEWRWFATHCLAIAIGSSVYGATIGLWRAPLQSVFTAIKFPLLIFLTCIGNGAVNGMLAQLFGSGLSFRQTALAILMSFAIASLILAGFSPIMLFVLYNAPPLESAHAIVCHSMMF